jgi:hypothetical protein
MTKKSKAVFISLPYYRIARVTLYSGIINEILKQADVYVISPFANNEAFTSKFSANLRHVKFQPTENLRFLNWLLSVSEHLRMKGYVYKYMDNGMRFYKLIDNIEFGNDGEDKRLSFLSRSLNWFCGTIGRNKNAWKFFDIFFGNYYYKKMYIESISRDYKQCILIQSASWGVQDRTLNWLAGILHFRKVFIPYTTDQITLNGYLMSNFNALCVQGPVELRYAKMLQKVKSESIIKLGSCWFRHIDYLKEKIESSRENSSSLSSSIIIYAGLSRLYFPRISELNAIDAILDYIDDKNIQLIYRPVIESENEKEALKEMYISKTKLSFQWPEASCIGLSDIPVNHFENELLEYVKSLEKVQVVVTSLMTSFALDSAYISKAGIIVNFHDPTGTIDRRNMKHILNHLGKHPFLPACKVAFDLGEMINGISEIIENESKRLKNALENYNEWDYDPQKFESNLNIALFES